MCQSRAGSGNLLECYDPARAQATTQHHASGTHTHVRHTRTRNAQTQLSRARARSQFSPGLRGPGSSGSLWLAVCAVYAVCVCVQKKLNFPSLTTTTAASRNSHKDMGGVCSVVWCGVSHQAHVRVCVWCICAVGVCVRMFAFTHYVTYITRAVCARVITPPNTLRHSARNNVRDIDSYQEMYVKQLENSKHSFFKIRSF